MSNWPDRTNPREVRAFAHTQVERLRRREIPYQLAQIAVADVASTTKGSRSGLLGALARAASYEAVEGSGSRYTSYSWPSPGRDDKVHIFFENIPENTTAPEYTASGTDDSWLVIRDELAARGYGIHDAGHGSSVVAVVLDRDLDIDVYLDIYRQYGLLARNDPIHQTSIA